MTTDSTGQVVPLHGKRHEDLQDLLPWYVTGKLEPAELAQVETHLGRCAECQAEVRFQRQLNTEIAALPVDVEHSWQAMRARLQADGRRGSAPLWRAWVGWAAAGVVLVAAGALILPTTGQTPAYHALGAAPAAAAGNLVVIFRPEAREQDLRAALRAAGARLVDGPTAADGYVLRVAPADRATALAHLRAQPTVVLAEPIGAGR